jgi:hypothetical protein
MKPPGALVVSLDFEQHWGVLDKLAVAECRERLVGVQRAIPAMLDLFVEFDVHATWATVGLLLFDDKREMLSALPERRPRYARRGVSPYDFLDAVGEGERDDPFHFAPSLVRRIADTPGQEIGTHTFCHYYCLEPGQSAADFRADLAVAVEVTRQKLGRRLRSIVFPRNQLDLEYVLVCREMGLEAYRGNLANWAYRARQDEGESLFRRGVRLLDSYCALTGCNARPLVPGASPVDVPASRYLRPYVPAFRHLEPLRLRRVRADLDAAARGGLVYHLWWHPHDFGLHVEANLAVLRAVLEHFRELRETHGLQSCTMAEAAGRMLSLDLGPAAELVSRPAGRLSRRAAG